MAHVWVTCTAVHYGLTVEELTSVSRKQYLVRARWVAMQLLHGEGMSTPKIARELGRRDHDCVLDGLAKLADDPELQAVVKRIRAKERAR